ncbi:2-phospho-L-lactate transferase [Sphingosinicella terrae]|uniref:2-phospho-L-lactate transferase n=1 Tax=Sphingosinicella terrae TaxID=2172047 RepID=UPI002546E8ED|nr:2-phospho-L-lactate transferase [Sphingosinicella terrae]
MTRILALAGGVGGAKLAYGLAARLDPAALTIVVNTGDDFDHLGLRICPDLDTVAYTLAGLNDRERGWGLDGESWTFLAALERLGGETWFGLGDGDLAMHVLRTCRLRTERLSKVISDLFARLGVAHRVVPMSDDPVRTMVLTDEGLLAFQNYFVRRHCAPSLRAVRFEGIEAAAASPEFIEALEGPELEAIVICPSNPILSIAPILGLPGIGERLRARRVPVVAVSPFVGGAALKGPAARNLRDLGFEPTAEGLLRYYAPLIDGLVVDRSDAPGEALDIPVFATDILIPDPVAQARLAGEVLAFTGRLRADRS